MELKDKFLSQRYGFIRGRGTINALVDLISDIQINFAKKEYMGSVFLNIEEAFNYVKVDILKEKICKLGIPCRAALNIIQLFKGRQMCVKTLDNKLLDPRLVCWAYLRG